MDKLGQQLRKKLDKNTSDFITERYFNKGDKLFLCSDGVSDTLTNQEIAGLVYTYRNSAECLKHVVNGIYQRANEKLQKGHNNPPSYLIGNSQFKNTVKTNEDNISAIIVEKGDSDGR